MLGTAACTLEPVAAERELVRDLATVEPTDVGIDPERLRRLDAGMQAMVDDGKLAGVVTMLARHGKLVSVGVTGVQDVETGAPMTRDSIFQIYSMTKPITGVAMMILYEEGKWRLNDPVSKYIPEFADLDVHIGDNADGSMKREVLGRPMRMRHLMTHTAGLGYTLNPRHPVHQMFLDQRVLDPEEPLQTMITRMAVSSGQPTIFPLIKKLMTSSRNSNKEACIWPLWWTNMEDVLD